MRMRVLVLAALTVGLAVGCALKPAPTADATRAQALPALVVPGAWVSGNATQGSLQDQWLASFADPQLDALVQEALANNPDVRAAAARIEQAAAFVQSAESSLYPDVSVAGTSSGKSTGSDAFNYGGLFANWEIDLWGRVRSGRAAAELQLIGTELAYEYVRQSIAAMVARSWFLATEARLQMGLAQAAVKSAEDLVHLATERARVGIGNHYDVSVARALLATQRDGVQQTDLALRQAIQAIEALAGRYPAAALEVTSALPSLPDPVPAGLPAELLERRPDVVAAERLVAAAFYRIEEAKAARLPSLSLKASASTLSSDLVLLKERDDWVWGMGGKIIAPLDLGGGLKAQVRLRTAEQDEAIAGYGRAGAAAFADVERALAAGTTLELREPLLQEAVAENERALTLVEERYRVGTEDLRAVEQQQLQLLTARTALLRVQSDQLVQRVNLHLALGGSF